MNEITNPETNYSISSIPDPKSYERTLNRIFDILYRFNRVNIVGQDSIPNREPLLVVANHRGTGDIPAVARALQPHGLTRFVAKSELLQVPIIGKQFVDKWGAILLDRKTRGLEIIPECLETFKHSIDPYVGIFPEGTRKKKDIETIDLVPALTARIACYGNVRILPIGIDGTEKHRNLIGFKSMNIFVGNPIDSVDLSHNIGGNRQPLSKSDKNSIRDVQSDIQKAMQDAYNEAKNM